MIRSRRPQTWIPRALAATALVFVALGLSACVSDSNGGSGPVAFSPAPKASPTSAPSTSPTTPTAVALAPIPRDKPVAIVAGQPIAGSDYANFVAQQRTIAAAQAQQQGAPPPSEQQIRSQALTTLVDTAIIYHYARQHGITATAQEVQRQYDATKAQVEQQGLQSGQAVTFTVVLRQYGYTEASFKKTIADNILGGKVEQKQAPAGTIEAVRARHILIGPPPSSTGSVTPTVKAKPDSVYKAEAEAIYRQLKANPGQFATLARQKSVDTGSGVQGGELGWFVKGMMVPSFDKAAYSLPIGQISAPVKSQYGYHIIQVEERKTVPYTALPQSAQQAPAVQALAQKQQTRFRQWLSAERARDHVRILYKV